MGFEITLRKAARADAAACAKILQDWLDSTPWMPRLHDIDETTGFFSGDLFAHAEVWIAASDGAVAGYIALQDDDVRSFTVAADLRGRGIGSRLIALAKAERPLGLCLWTFVANPGARAFYARHGFREVGGTDGDNEEGLPDLRLCWTGAPA